MRSLVFCCRADIRCAPTGANRQLIAVTSLFARSTARLIRIVMLHVWLTACEDYFVQQGDTMKRAKRRRLEGWSEGRQVRSRPKAAFFRIRNTDSISRVRKRPARIGKTYRAAHAAGFSMALSSIGEAKLVAERSETRPQVVAGHDRRQIQHHRGASGSGRKNTGRSKERSRPGQQREKRAVPVRVLSGKITLDARLES